MSRRGGGGGLGNVGAASRQVGGNREFVGSNGDAHATAHFPLVFIYTRGGNGLAIGGICITTEYHEQQCLNCN